MSEGKEHSAPAKRLDAERVEGELGWLRQRIIALIHEENPGVALRACKLYYDVLCDAEAIGCDASRQHGRPLKIIFRGKEETVG